MVFKDYQEVFEQAQHEYFVRWGWKRNSFTDASFPGESTYVNKDAKAVAEIVKSMESEQGSIIIVRGEVGIGKSNFAELAISSVRGYEACYVQDPGINTPLGVLGEIGIQLGLDIEKIPYRTSDTLEALRRKIIEKYVKESLKTLIVVDEAQRMAKDLFFLLKSFADIHYNEKEICKVVLVGEPRLITKLKGDEYESLRDRVLVDCELGVFSPEETREAVLRRLAYNRDEEYGPDIDPRPFNDEAINGIYTATGGHPRKVIQLCADLINYCIEFQRDSIDVALLESYAVLEPQKATQGAR